MRILRHVALLTLILALLPAGILAQVKTEEKNQVKFGGAIGRVMGMFGGKAAKEGVIDTVAVKSNRKATLNPDSGEIIDLDEEKVYQLDLRRKSYKVVTFAELRRQMEEAQARAAEAMKEEPPDKPRQPDQPQMEIDFSLKESGQKKRISGYDCREVIATAVMRQKGKTLEQGGGMVMTSNTWLAPEIPFLKEIADFDRRYAEKLYGSSMMGVAAAQQMAAALAMYPGIREMMGKMEAEKVNMTGTEILTVATIESVKSAEQMQQEQQQNQEQGAPKSIGGLGGLLGRKLAKKPEQSDQPANRAIIMTITHELVKATPSASDADVSIPAGFKPAG